VEYLGIKTSGDRMMMIQRILETAEMKMLKEIEITNKILRDRPRSEDIGKT
jgi:hypothetical protein